ncbi:MAG: anion permease [Bifidobacteriaceae bacterium]|nr:anion permease [Bifidobacteriaceae bacterium]
MLTDTAPQETPDQGAERDGTAPGTKQLVKGPPRPGGIRPVRLVPTLIPLAVGLLVWFLPGPDGVSPKGWHMLAIFLATVIGIITKPLPMGAVCIVGLVASVLTGTVPMKAAEPGGPSALMGFADPTIWLIVTAFLISRGFIKTGLGRRLGLAFVSRMGGSTLGVSYSLALADLVLAPAIPSATARGGGMMTPIMRSVAELYDSRPGPTARRAGAFLAINVGQVNAITCAMFLTSMAGNPMIASLAAGQGVTISWTSWAVGALVPGLAALVVVPWVVYKVYPPELKRTPEAQAMARRELKEQGPMTPGEWVMAGTFALLLALWTVGDMALGVSATTTGFVGFVVLLVTGVLTWEDVTKEKAAWDTMIWFAVLMTMAAALSHYGLIDYIANLAGSSLASFSWPVAFVLLTLVYFFSHYLFASAIAHISAMYLAFLAAAIQVGTPPMFAALVLGYISNLIMSLTQYAGGASPAVFGTGYNTVGQWWRVSFVAALASIAVWMSVGGGWLKLIGYW